MKKKLISVFIGLIFCGNAMAACENGHIWTVLLQRVNHVQYLRSAPPMFRGCQMAQPQPVWPTVICRRIYPIQMKKVRFITRKNVNINNSDISIPRVGDFLI